MLDFVNLLRMSIVLIELAFDDFWLLGLKSRLPLLFMVTFVTEGLLLCPIVMLPDTILPRSECFFKC